MVVTIRVKYHSLILLIQHREQWDMFLNFWMITGLMKAVDSQKILHVISKIYSSSVHSCLRVPYLETEVIFKNTLS